MLSPTTPDDLVAPLAVRQANAYGPADGLLAKLITAHERVVDDGDERRAHAIGVGEISAVHERRPHGVEPARGCGIAPESIRAQVLYRHGPIVDRDAVGSPATAGEQRHSGERRRPHAGHGRRGGAQALGQRTALLDRRSTRLQVQLRDQQRLGHEAERQLVERRERAEEEPGRGDQHQRQGDLCDHERAADGEAMVAGESSTGILERLTRRQRS